MVRLKEILENKSTVLSYEVLSDQSHEEATFIVEGGLTMNLDKRWSVRFDRGLQPGQQDHLHVLKRGNQICVINKDGSPSHNTTIDLPSKIKTKIARLNMVFIEEAAVLLEEASVFTLEIQNLLRQVYIRLEAGA